MKRLYPRFLPFVLGLHLLLLASTPAVAQEYAALRGVQGVAVVFDYSAGAPERALVVLPAMREVWRDRSVTSLAEPPRAVIVFRGGAVKLLSTARQGDVEENQALDRVGEMLQSFAREGVGLEVCLYAVRVAGVDPATLLPEVKPVGNGFISVAGYQAQGYALIVP